MSQYVARRLLLLIPTLLLGTLLVFLMLRVLPGDEATIVLGDRAVTAAERAAVERRLGLDDPLPVRYLDFLGGLLRGDLGESVVDGRPVLDRVREALPVTLELGVLAVLIAVAVAIPVGVVSAARRNTPLDYALRFLANVGLAVPIFWTGSVVLLGLTLWVGWTPALRYTPLWRDPLENLSQFVVPAVILGLALAAAVMRITRSMMLDVLGEDYIRAARARGLGTPTVIRRHALPNALIPVVTVVGVQIANVIGGTVVLETIFALPGMGTHLIRALEVRDFAVVQGLVVVVLVGVVWVNLAVDLVARRLDPRTAAP